MPENISVSSDLEQFLKKKVKTSAAKFPRRDARYFEHYTSIKQRLADKYYAVTGAALAQSDGDRYTKHDISHVDDVIQTAGRMLGFGHDNNSPAYKLLHPYEVFVLLVAILLHDAGNAIGRKKHETKAAEILREVAPAAGLSALEQRIISSIAQAHGGKMEDGNEDTITGLMKDPEPNIGDIKIHAWRLAALVRLADELSENHTRADEVAIESAGTPDLSLLANYYCLVINPKIDFIGKSVHLVFDVEKQLLPRVFRIPKDGGGMEDIMFVDYIARRLEKGERERKYCNRFLAGFAGYDRIRAKLVIMENGREIDSVAVDLEEVGYPGLSKSVKALQPRFDACVLRDQHCKDAVEDQVT
ncbi:HD domain-containing protein [Rhizobium leguminosarum]|uniref:HD domain-containing protein n=1 Tax=Rhizobium leguminosarum TaxID=384 RepID=UPI001031B1F9|nr:HD domain-containing protein [Rhizobium leguminosarum]TAV10201.1 HD domain-containing protein [Rhizobium leguminosarum]